MSKNKVMRVREQSSISFPYVDLCAAVEVARAIYEVSGTDPCDLSKLADDLSESMGGAFRLRTSAARIFDLLEKRGRSEVKLTESGVTIVEKEDDRDARANAFLRVPLYAAVFRKYHDRSLPDRHHLEDEMRELGVPAKQVDKARQVFERSARQAGLFDVSSNRLVHPREREPQIGNNSRLAPQSMLDVDGRYASRIAEGAGMNNRRSDPDPLIVGLIERLPDAGSEWSDSDRVAWLRLASSIFDVTYAAGNSAAGRRPIEIRLTDDIVASLSRNIADSED